MVAFAFSEVFELVGYTTPRSYKGIEPHTSRESLERRQRQQLQYSDDQTGGVMGLMPLVIGMPMWCSDVADRKRTLCKHTRIKLVGSNIQPEDACVVEACTDAE